jgi:prolyl-tRNA synthetase
VIVPIFKNNERNIVIEESKRLLAELKEQEFRAILDDREDYTAGWKFNDWEIKGVPLRINIGLRDIKNQKIEIVRRDTGEKLLINRKDSIENINYYLDEIQKFLFRRAKKIQDENIIKISHYDEMKRILKEKGGFIIADWCEKEECENNIKNDTGADIRLIPFNESNSKNKCIYCNMNSTKTVVFAKAY